jgi:hypothetical protein
MRRQRSNAQGNARGPRMQATVAELRKLVKTMLVVLGIGRTHQRVPQQRSNNKWHRDSKR